MTSVEILRGSSRNSSTTRKTTLWPDEEMGITIIQVHGVIFRRFIAMLIRKFLTSLSILIAIKMLNFH